MKFKIQLARTLTISCFAAMFVALPFFGIVYGTTSVLKLGTLTVISPLDWALVTLGTRTIHPDLVLPVVVSTLTVVVFGRFLCGWICPVGLMLDFSHNLTLHGKTRVRPFLVRKHEKFLILLVVLTATLFFNIGLSYLFSPPGIVYRAIFYYVSHGIVGTDIVLMLFLLTLDNVVLRYGRTWCNTICPLGTLLGLLSIINLVKPRINSRKCTICLECEKVCPMGIPVTSNSHWEMSACTKCMKCLERCPTKAIGLL